MTNNPLVSIIIPCYNSGEFIEETLASAINQTYQNTEIIIADDGSDDKNTIDILKNLTNPKIKVLFLDHIGVANARNTAIREARGEYISPLDSDDKIHVEYIEKAVKVLNEDDKVGIVYSKAMLFGDEEGEWNLADYSFPEILIHNTILCSAIFRKKDFEQTNGYNPNMVGTLEDYDFWLSLIELGVKVHRIPETLFYYRVRNQSRNSMVDQENAIKLMGQMFRNHQQLYTENIEVLFKELFRLRNNQKTIFRTKWGKSKRLRVVLEEIN